MLNNAKSLQGYKLDSLDGEFGEVKEFYFDDRHWTIRYLVANTGGWLTGRQVLISPYALVAAVKAEQHISIDLTKKQIEGSPSLNNDKPVSRQFEESYYGYYGYPTYWGGPFSWGAYPYPTPDREQWKEPSKSEKAWDSHLRSTDHVCGYHIEATDGKIGHVEDFIIDDETWTIRYLVVDTGTWWQGHQVLIAPQWITDISWERSSVTINLTQQAIQDSPRFDSSEALNRQQEADLHQYYGRPAYWEREHNRNLMED